MCHRRQAPLIRVRGQGKLTAAEMYRPFVMLGFPKATIELEDIAYTSKYMTWNPFHIYTAVQWYKNHHAGGTKLAYARCLRDLQTNMPTYYNAKGHRLSPSTLKRWILTEGVKQPRGGGKRKVPLALLTDIKLLILGRLDTGECV
jgi:hypothetical protein